MIFAFVGRRGDQIRLSSWPSTKWHQDNPPPLYTKNPLASALRNHQPLKISLPASCSKNI